MLVLICVEQVVVIKLGEWLVGKHYEWGGGKVLIR